MSFQNEEGIPIIEQNENVSRKQGFSRVLIVALTLAVLATVGVASYAGVTSSPSTSYLVVDTQSFPAQSVPAQSVPAQSVPDNKVSAEPYSSPSDENKNAQFLASIVNPAFEAMAYLNGKTVQLPFPTIKHGLAEDGDRDYHTRPYFTLTMNFFGDVYKDVYNIRDKKTLEGRDLIGTMKGLDSQGNIVFIDGGYCAAENGPSYGKIEVLCGHTALTVKQITPCNMRIFYYTPDACVHIVKTVEPTDGAGKGKGKAS